MAEPKTPEELMRRAIEISRGGFPAPNPHVGCVIVRDGEIVGEGFHHYAGGPHAEIGALKAAGAKAVGATVYVSQEPCNHHGRTGPCSEALIEARVARVEFAVADPNPPASGGGQKLAAAGIDVSQGLLAEEAAEANWLFLRAMTLRRPVVVVKAAATLDGKIALPNGESKWITSELAREEGHRLRAELGCVLVGAGTVLADDPRLTARIEGVVNQPLRVVLDRDAVLTGKESIFDGSAETLHVVGKPSTAPTQLLQLNAMDGNFDLAAVLDHLLERKCIGVLIEGGAATIGSFLRAGLADRAELFLAPKIFGAGKSWVEGPMFESLESAINGRIDRVKSLGPDLQISVDLS